MSKNKMLCLSYIVKNNKENEKYVTVFLRIGIMINVMSGIIRA